MYCRTQGCETCGRGCVELPLLKTTKHGRRSACQERGLVNEAALGGDVGVAVGWAYVRGTAMYVDEGKARI
jgi:hypothetical protein